MTLAWTIANLSRTSPKKKLQSLKSLLVPEGPKVVQSPQQMLAIAKQWTLMMGGTITKATKADS